jgi:hypothetical protein
MTRTPPDQARQDAERGGESAAERRRSASAVQYAVDCGGYDLVQSAEAQGQLEGEAERRDAASVPSALATRMSATSAPPRWG